MSNYAVSKSALSLCERVLCCIANTHDRIYLSDKRTVTTRLSLMEIIKILIEASQLVRSSNEASNYREISQNLSANMRAVFHRKSIRNAIINAMSRSTTNRENTTRDSFETPIAAQDKAPFVNCLRFTSQEEEDGSIWTACVVVGPESSIHAISERGRGKEGRARMKRQGAKVKQRLLVFFLVGCSYFIIGLRHKHPHLSNATARNIHECTRARMRLHACTRIP